MDCSYLNEADTYEDVGDNIASCLCDMELIIFLSALFEIPLCYIYTSYNLIYFLF